MKGHSLRLRLWSAAIVSIVLAIIVSGIGLGVLFEHHLERRADTDLSFELTRLIAATHFGPDGALTVAPLSDPRFDMPASGNYWQVEDMASGRVVRSRSLWDSTLSLPPSPAGQLSFREIEGDGGHLLLSGARTIIDPGGRSFRAIVAEDHGTIEESLRSYLRELAPALAVLGGLLIVANFLQITIGLSPLGRIKGAVRDVVSRKTSRLAGLAPNEVQPLADEINHLLENQEKALSRARLRATDLAHGLKTPLQVLSADVRLLRARGETDLAEGIERSVEAIRRHIERELARARLAPQMGGQHRSRLAEIAASVVSVVRRTPRGEGLSFVIDAEPDLRVPIDESDLAELLGNLVENAAHFAKSTVRIAGSATGGETTIVVADDGSGIAEKDRHAVLLRGVRLAGSGGHGLGLAIVSDIVEAYDGELVLGDCAPGLKVTIILPAVG
ncbi:MAG: HAMP domain-containing histidine kinase [Rhizobiales bacterium]|nr:HAMP domain-containing histidine kinase [Hyphomicrobiales bacterium]